MEALKRGLSELCDKRLVDRGNKFSQALFASGVHSIRQACRSASESRGAYRFLGNDRVSELDILNNLRYNCISACRGKTVLCIQDTTEINLSGHRGRIKSDGHIGKTQGGDLGFYLHPSFVVDAADGTPYGYSSIKSWCRPFDRPDKYERRYGKLPFDQKQSYKWFEVSRDTKNILGDVVGHMIIVQDREGDIYEQYCGIPDGHTDLLVRAGADRRLCTGGKLSDALSHAEPSSSYQVGVDSGNKRVK